MRPYKLLISTFKLHCALRILSYMIPTLGNWFWLYLAVKYVVYICKCSRRPWKEGTLSVSRPAITMCILKECSFIIHNFLILDYLLSTWMTEVKMILSIVVFLYILCSISNTCVCLLLKFLWTVLCLDLQGHSLSSLMLPAAYFLLPENNLWLLLPYCFGLLKQKVPCLFFAF